VRPGLLFADRDLDVDSLPVPDPSLVADLGMDRLYAAMSQGDEFLDELARRIVPAPLGSVEAIRYRQATVTDALAAPEVVRELYAIAVDAIEAERKVWGSAMRNAELVLDRAAEVIGLFLASFRAMRQIEADHAGAFRSPAFVGFFERIATQLDDTWLAEADDHVQRLRTRTLHVSGRLGTGNRGTGYVLHRRPNVIRGWRGRLGLEERRSTVEVPLKDQHSMNMISELRGMAIAPTAGVVRESQQWILAFFKVLRAELGFLVGCLNLHDAMRAVDGGTCMPDPVAGGEPAFSARGLYDPGLRLSISGPVVGNDVMTDGARIVVITGANGGGKSTILRAVGLAQVMLHAGMFVAADLFTASLHSNVLTHFTREEDATLRGGKLHEELGRLATVVDACTPTSLVLLNESLASTNEREGAEIARQVITALADSGVDVWFVTHNHQFAAGLHEAALPGLRFLRAERGGDGERSFHIVEAQPQPTSHGMDLYRRIVGEA
jgi:MutS domain V